MSMKLIGSQRLAKKFEKFSNAAIAEVRDAIAESALIIQNEARRSIQKGPKTGRTYRKGSIGGTVVGHRVSFKGGKTQRGSSIKKGVKGFNFHRASAPGEAPATDSGRLVSHINFSLTDAGMRARIGVEDLSSVVYARRMEFGGKDKRGVYIAPRPYIKPAFDKNIKVIIVKLQTAYKSAGRRIARGG